MIRFSTLMALLLFPAFGCHDSRIQPSSNAAQSPADQLSVNERVKATIAMQLGLNETEFSLSDGLQEQLGADELDMVELTMELEEEFSIAIPDSAVIEEGKTAFDGIPAGFSGADFARIVQEQLSNQE